MLKHVLFKILPKKVFRFGEGSVTRYTLIEIRWLFSIYFHHIETFGQDRFHTHAFNAIVFILSGSYKDCIKNGIGPNKLCQIKMFKAGNIRWISRELNHKLLSAENDTISLLFVGPYSTLWTEELDDGTLKIITKHQQLLYKGKIN